MFAPRSSPRQVLHHTRLSRANRRRCLVYEWAEPQLTPIMHLVFDEAPLEIRVENGTYHRFFNLWHAFKKDHAATSAGQCRTRWHAAMYMITWRAMEHVDAIRVLSSYGRPAAVHILFRTLYESWLNLLLIGFHDGHIDREKLIVPRGKHLKPWTERPWLRSPTKEQLARRYLAYAWSVEGEVVQEWARDQEEWVSMCAEMGRGADAAEEILAAFIARAKKANSLYEFGGSWSPFRTVGLLKEHLWPEHGEPRFPKGLANAIGPRVWKEAFRQGYIKTSHFAHGSSATFGAIGRPAETRSAIVDDSRYYDLALMQQAQALGFFCTAAFAGAVGAMNEWNRTVGQL